MAGRGTAALVLSALALGIAPAVAAAAPDCGPAPQLNHLAQGQGQLESVIVDRDGRLFFSDLTDDRLLRLDAPGAAPSELARFPDPGGLALDDDGTLIAGTGNAAANGALGDVVARAGLLRVDPETGATEPFATGLAMANGLDRAPDGTLYASNDFGRSIDRISPSGEVDHGWASVLSGNGVVVDSAGEYLYVAQTFQPAAIQRVNLDDPGDVTPFAVAEAGLDWAAGLDGLARDAADNIFAAANGAGEVWKVDPQGRICALVRGLPRFPDGPSAVATGKGTGPFPATSLYVVTFAGDLIEVENVATPPASRRGRARR